MRLGIRAKQIAGITIVVGIFVVGLTAQYVALLTSSSLKGFESSATVLANQIDDLAALIDPGAPDPHDVLRTDPGVQKVFMSIAFFPGVSDMAIVDADGIVVASSNEESIPTGRKYPQRQDLAALVASGALEQLRPVYADEPQKFEVRQNLKNIPGSVRVGVSTFLVKGDVGKLLTIALQTGGIALFIGIVVAVALSHLLIRPIHVLRSGLTRLGKGEFGVKLDLPPGDEFGELGAFFNTVSAQLSADRSQLADQKASLQSAVEHLEDAVALFAPSGQLLFTNPAMQPTLPAGAIGQTLGDVLTDGHPYRTLVEETLASRSSRGPVHLTSPPGEKAGDHLEELLVMAHAVEGMGGDLVGVLLVARNLAYLSRMQSTLAYSRKLVALGRLTAGIAHEVKNPLNAMMIHLELLRTKVKSWHVAAGRTETVAAGAGVLRPLSGGDAPPPDAGGLLDHVEVIEGEIRRLDEVVQGFLKFTRPEDLRLRPVRVADLFDEILPLVEAEAGKTGVRVVAECPASVPGVHADAAMMRQAFLNLAINACQAMPNGGVLKLGCNEEPHGRVAVRFEDNGVGIRPDHLQKIFDLYFTTKDHGTGIGLSLVYRIVQLHDGDVEVQSTPGRGSVFRLVLPRAPDQPEQ
jgi:signal transduction histidine kinase